MDTKAQATQAAAALQFGELGIYRYRTDGIVSAMDEGAFHIFGLNGHFSDPESVVGVPLSKLILEGSATALTGGERSELHEVHGITCTFRTLEGELKNVVLDSYLGHSVKGNEVFVQVVIRSLSRGYHSSWHTAQESYKYLFRALPEAAIVFDFYGHVLEANPSACRLYGYSYDELLHKTGNDFLHAHYRHLFDSFLKRVREEGVYTIELMHLRSNGESFFVSMRGAHFAWEDAGYILAIMRDITAVKRMEVSARENEEQFRLQFRAVPIPATVWRYEDDDFVLTAFNRAADLSSEGLIMGAVGKMATDIFFDVPEIVEDLRACYRDRTVGKRETTFVGRFVGGERDVVFTYVYVSKDQLLVFSEDITERKRAEKRRIEFEAQVQQTQKLESMGLLASGIAHDFNNLLMGVLGPASMLSMDLPADSPHLEVVQQISKSAQDAKELCKQLLAYTGKGHIQTALLDINALITEMTPLLKLSISKRAKLQIDLAPVLPAVCGDSAQLHQIVMNLVINASEAIGEHNGRIEVRTGKMQCDKNFFYALPGNEELKEGEYVYIRVSDTGCGMDRDVRTKVFDPFFTTKVEGRGLGLAAVYGIARSHQGAVKVQSEPGRGTTFRVLLPASEERMQEKVAPVHDSHLPQWHHSGTALIVDDETMVRKMACAMLKRIGFEVLSAENGEQGVQEFQAHSDTLTLVLLDMTMPTMSGLEAFKAMKKIRTDVPIVFTSGYNEEEITEEIAAEELAGFIQKPYQARELTEVLKKIFESPEDA